MDWKTFFEKQLVELRKSPILNIYIAPKHTNAVLELKNQRIVEVRQDCLVTKSATAVSDSHSFIQYEDIYYVYQSKECLIVTAAVGSPQAAEVVWLKELRDSYISKSFTYFKLINGFESIYYIFSPQISRTMLINPPLKTVIRRLFVTPFLKIIRILQSRIVHKLLVFNEK